MRGIEKLHPAVRIKAERLVVLCNKNGLPIKITETLRTKAEQDAIYAQGRTTPGKIVSNAPGTGYQSPHQWGVAFDFCRNVKGKEYDNSDGFFESVGALGKSVGLFWGGDYRTMKDSPHFEDITYVPGNSTRALREQYVEPEAFMGSW
jgi:peptidoglycan L-alanyl-D-glutamate endopeptidase CwlK